MTERTQLEQAIVHLESQRATLGDATVDAAIAGLKLGLAALEKPESGGERKLVTIMFADISGFTALAEKTDPEVVRDLMNRCFDSLVPCIKRFDGTIDKFIGDEIMALFGAPMAHENDPERALRSALEMQSVLAQFNAEHKTRLDIHFGINTGLVLAGGIGSSGQQEYSVMGDAVNLAARLEDVAEHGQILAGPDTYRLTAPLFDFEALSPVNAKGRTEPVAVYRLVSAKARTASARGLERKGLSSPLVGRSKEFETMQNCLAALRCGQGGVVGVIGEAGLGKSRLMAELCRGAPDLQWLEGKTLLFGQSISYWPFQEIVRHYAGIGEDDSELQAWQKLEGRISALFLDTALDILPYLATLLAVEVQGEYIERVKYLDGDALGKRVFLAMRRFVEQLARRRPLALVFEDLHWMDTSSVELLEHLLPLAREVPLLLIGVSRPDPGSAGARLREVCANKYTDCYTEIRLAPLSPAESAQLVHNLLAIDNLPAQVRETMMQKAEGNPFFIEEILRSLLDMGAILRNPATGRWRTTAQIEAVRIPDTVQGVIMARIDRLDEDVKQALHVAAVIGRSFLYRILRKVDQADGALDAHLAHLQQVELIREKKLAPELEYIFKHALAQEATYESILIQERRDLHGRVAAAVEALFADRLDEFYSLLAYHYAKAENWAKAQAYLFKSGDQAGHMAADAEALAHYQQALAAYTKAFGDQWNPLQRAQVERKLGEALVRRGENEQAVQHLRQALVYLGRPLPTQPFHLYLAIGYELAVQVGHRLFPALFLKPFQETVDPTVQEMGLIIDTLGFVIMYTTPTEGILPILRRLNESEREGYAPGMTASAVMGNLFAYLSLYRLARLYQDQCMACAKWLKDPLVLGVALDGMRVFHWLRGEHDQAILCAQKSADWYRTAGGLFEWGQVHNGVANGLNYKGNMTQAIPYLEEEIRVAKEAGIPNLHTIALSTLGFAYLWLGQFDKAIAILQECLKVSRANSFNFNIVSGGGALVVCFLRTDQRQQAQSLLQEIYLIYRKNQPFWGAEMPLLWGRAEYYLDGAEQANESERTRWLNLARPACDEAIQAGQRCRPGLPEAMRLRGVHAWLGGKPAAAHKWWQRGLASAEKMGQRYDIGRLHLEIGQRLSDLEHLQKAESIFADMGALADMEKARAIQRGITA